MKLPITLRCAFVSLLAITAAPLSFAGSAPQVTVGKAEAPPEQTPINLFRVDSSYDFESNFKRGGGALGKQDAIYNSFEFGHRIPLNLEWPQNQGGNWFLRLGAEYSRFDFGSSKAPVPTTLQSADAVIALEYIVHGQAGIFIETRPGVYFQNNVSGKSFDFPSTIAFAYPVVADKFYIIGGVATSMLREYPVLPVGGVLWRIDPKWDLRAYLPDPRLVYKPCENVEIWAGGQVTGGSYSTDKANVTPQKLSGAAVDYLDVRGGAGVTCACWKPFIFDLGAGYSFYREFNYHRAGDRFALEGAPYVRAVIKAEF